MPLPKMQPQRNGSSLAKIEAAVPDRLGGGDHGELREAIELAGGAGIENRLGLKPLTSPPNLTLKAVVSNERDGRDAARAGEEPSPVVRHVQAERVDRPQPGDDHPAARHGRGHCCGLSLIAFSM